MEIKLNNFKYGTFGLRKGWINLFFDKVLKVISDSNLGPRQKDALYYYLKDFNLIANKSSLTESYFILKTLYEKSSIDSLTLWGILLVNLYFNASLFSFWGTLRKGLYYKKETMCYIVSLYAKSNRYVINGYLSLIGTFERTPIGTGLKIGAVKKEGTSRVLCKEGGYNFDPFIILYSLYVYAKRFNEYSIDLENLGDKLYSSQKIFAITTEQTKNSLLSLNEPGFFTFKYINEKSIVSLDKEKNNLDVITLILNRR